MTAKFLRCWGNLRRGFRGLAGVERELGSHLLPNSSFLGTAYSLYCLGWAAFPHKK